MERFEEGGSVQNVTVHGEEEDVKYFLRRCKAWSGEREELMEKRR